ncbi:pentapeptide repeat-containing protein [Chromobacterium haemolyticum]|uniref:pentapeptide repeat-containing protein n=1 Tax=Chromobacterium haemolyticum TaxID=394935 RepID=UPI0002E47235|nr:pentapeptide repeat-containing protein [Chromobacterium haemolyticum]
MNGEVMAPAPQEVRGQRFTEVGPQQAVSGVVYIDCHFDGVHWRGNRLSDIRFVNCRFEDNRFEGGNWLRIQCEQCQFRRCVWNGCALEKVFWQGGAAVGIEWRQCGLKDFTCVELHAGEWRLLEPCSSHVSFINSRLEQWWLSGGVWLGSSWIKNQLSDIGIQRVELDNFIVGLSQVQRMALLECHGINARWLNCELDEMTVTSCRLRQAAWSGSAWRGGVLQDCQLAGANFEQSRLSHLQIVDTRLEQAIFHAASLEDCQLSRLHAPQIWLRRARLQRVDLSQANLNGLDACDAELRQVRLSGGDCGNGRLIGQPRGVWQEANTDGAIFSDQKFEQNQAWHARVQPGPRGEQR